MISLFFVLLPWRLQDGAHTSFGLVVTEEEASVSLCKQTALSHTAGRSGQLVFPLRPTPHAIPARRWRQGGWGGGGLTCLLRIRFRSGPGPRCLVGLKAMRTGNHRGRLPTAAPPPFTPKALEDCGVVRLKANNVPTAHVHILSGSAAVPPVLCGKGLSSAIVWLWLMRRWRNS